MSLLTLNLDYEIQFNYANQLLMYKSTRLITGKPKLCIQIKFSVSFPYAELY